MKKISFIIKLALTALIVIAGLSLVGKYTDLLPEKWNPGKLFSHPLIIDKTETIVNEIRGISEFTTACFYEEKAMIGNKYQTKETVTSNLMDLLGLPKTGEHKELARIAYITKGKVRAGYDLSKIDDSGIRVSKDTLFVSLPKPEIFDVIVNPSDIREFDRQGQWSEDEINRIISKAKDEIRMDALSYGLMDKASTTGEDKLVALFKSFGFNQVILE